MTLNANSNQMQKCEEGFVLVTALIIMLVLTIIGIAATTNTSLELQIAGNNKVHNESFYGAEATANLGAELLEQNLNCAAGFSSENIGSQGNIVVDSSHSKFYTNPYPAEADILDTSLADIKFPLDFDNNNTANSYLKIGGESNPLPGSNQGMGIGYENNPSQGTVRSYNIFARHQGKNNSQSIIVLGWQHIVKAPPQTCNY